MSVGPVYVSEMSPKDYRGLMNSLLGLTFAVGILAALLFNIGFEKFPSGWRVAFAIIGLLGLISTVGMLFVPHTPR